MAGREGVAGVLARDTRAVDSAHGAHAGGADDLVDIGFDRIGARTRFFAGQTVEQGTANRQALRTAGAGPDIPRVATARPQAAIGARDTNEAVNVRFEGELVDLTRGQGHAHGMADDVNLAGTGTGDCIDQCIFDRCFFAATVIIAGWAVAVAPTGLEDLIGGVAAGAQLVVGVAEIGGCAGVAMY